MAVGAMGDVFFCCVAQQPPRKRRRIDRSMIGHPTNFVHTGHIGAGDVRDVATENGSAPTAQTQLHSMERQMQTKGGYDHATSVNVQLNVIDVQVPATSS